MTDQTFTTLLVESAHAFFLLRNKYIAFF